MDIEDLREIIGHVAMEKKTKLDLSNKDISVIPDEIGTLVHLKELNLSYNSISKLPAELFKLKKLETILLLRNDIVEIPSDIQQLGNLRTLDISYNPISEIPESFGSLTNLQNLDASYCNLKKLPVSFINLLSLKNLYLENNHFEFPPDKIIKRGLYATMHFLTEVKSKRENAKIVMQVFNMPTEIQFAFRQYVDCFREMVDSGQNQDVSIDINFLNKREEEDLEVETGTFIYEFVRFVKENISSFKNVESKREQPGVLDFQVMELRSHLASLNDSLNEKMSEIKEIHTQLSHLTHKLDRKMKY
jgi:Leucine-rich repeat (LRR) protein